MNKNFKTLDLAMDAVDRMAVGEVIVAADRPFVVVVAKDAKTLRVVRDSGFYSMHVSMRPADGREFHLATRGSGPYVSFKEA